MTLTACISIPAFSSGSGDTSIQFAPPPFAMTNLVVNDAVQTMSFDYMNLKVGDMFNLNALNFGFGRMAKQWDTGGLSLGFSEQLITGSMDLMGEKTSLFGFGIGMPFNIIFDPVSHGADDNSLPMYFGMHMSTMMMTGSFTYDYPVIDHFVMGFPVYRMDKYTGTIMVSTFAFGWQMGIQYGLNLGDAIKVIPYIDFSQEVVSLSSTDIYATGMDSSNSSNNGPLPLTMMPGFDVVIRPIGLSLGMASQTMKQEGGDVKQFNVHFRFTQKFRSICGL